MLVLPFLLTANASTIICDAGQCLQGYSNTTIGVTISASGASALLLPGQYTSTTNPQYLHNLLTSSSATLTSSPGFKNSSTSLTLPLNVAQEPGLSIYSDPLYSGEPGFTSIPAAPIGANSSTPLTARSLALSSGVWVALNSPVSANSRVIVWDSIPDTAQLPTTAPSSLTLFDVESAACSPPCSSGGICSAAGTCTCAAGFTGASCETCAAGFFGSSCAACPSGCSKCDDGLTGSGRCLDPTTANAPATCNCLNGACGADGSCTCTTGFTTAANGTACAQCAPGFFLTSNGDCSICAIGCTECQDGTGVCTTCKAGFTQDANDKTKCDVNPGVTSTGTTCPPGSFANGANCAPCSSACDTCTAGTANDCVQCATGTYLLNGVCVSADANGVCAGSSQIANNVQLECDSCGAKCTSCKIPNFSSVSTVNQLQCTGCVPGFFLSNGTCVPECPSGTFVSPQDNLTCTACDSSCTTCAGSSTFCLSCASNQLADAGKCVATCPSNTFSASGSCLACHPDCASCTGGAFDQCASCPATRPVLTNGRCLPTCSKTQFFDPTSSACVACDASCSSCSGTGPSQCLACASNTQVLRAGTCVAAACDQVVAGLGACLSEFVTTTTGSGAFPSATGINTPTTVTTTTTRKLAWWEILLMALGCAFIFIAVIWLCRRRSRKRRAAAQAQAGKLGQNADHRRHGWRWWLFRLRAGIREPPRQHEQHVPRPYVLSAGKAPLDDRALRTAEEARPAHESGGWRWRLVRLGEKLFGHRRSERVQTLRPLHISRPLDIDPHAIHTTKAPAPRTTATPRSSNSDSDKAKLLPQSEVHHHYHQHIYQSPLPKLDRPVSLSDQASALSREAPSLYSQVTGVPRRVPEPRVPLRPTPTQRAREATSRFSTSSTDTIATYYMTTAPVTMPGSSSKSKSRTTGPTKF